jgi:hypothetical protein
MMYGFAISLYNTTRWLYHTAITPPQTNIRITENGDHRLTEDNGKRIIE